MESNRQRKVAQIIQEDFAELFRKQAAESRQSILVSVSDVKVTAEVSVVPDAALPVGALVPETAGV